MLIELIYRDCKGCKISMHLRVTQTTELCTTCRNEGIVAGKKDARELRKMIKKEEKNDEGIPEIS